MCPISGRQASVIAEGSQTYQFKTAGIAASAKEVVRISEQFPRARLFEPLDSIEVINNSGCDITLSLNSPSEVYTIPAYMSKPIARKSFFQFSLTNESAVTAVAAGEITVHVKRLPPNIQLVANAA